MSVNNDSKQDDKRVVRVIDLGFGYSKYTSTVRNGNPITKSFPSIVVPASDKNMGGDFFKTRKTVTVRVDGNDYEVGEGVEYATNGYSRKVLNKQYVESVDYEALMKGALKMMKVNEIDVLIIGVPVDDYKNKSHELSKRWVGEINLDGFHTVTINSVACVPQPIGGYSYYGSVKNQYSTLSDTRNLIIDSGYFTFDWVLCDGMNVINSSSGSYEGGMHFLIKVITDELGPEANTLTAIKRIDEHFYKNKPFIFNGKEVELTPYKNKQEGVINRSIEAMATTLTDLKTIDNIILIGGSANMYEEAIKDKFKGREIITLEHSQLANALGYHIIGTSMS